ncbi:MAG: peptide chain release factor 2 [Deltaproteobacteria bacterium]|nr:peptide chain release factor 2 [Deltaproteobacteria bacterium]MBW1966716.1 peptide chain release factor 2 [Deltaproteobacteria bacterium]MBW2097266.1 peptide chain release factor 2 [Deltaproteobacteria bacterium]
MDKEMLRRDFWEDPKSRELLKERSLLIEQKDNLDGLSGQYEELHLLLEMAEEEEDLSALEDVSDGTKRLDKEIRRLELSRLLSGPHDRNNAIVTIHAGAGGTEAQDWADMLLRMYLRWCDRRGIMVEMLDLMPGDEAGTKSVTFLAKGLYAYGYLKSEAGVHRLVRISPFDASGRRHTSFASVFVAPELDETIEVDINEKDLRIDTYRASGAGGQHVNKTSSAVRITHLPTGIVVQCQNQRSQHKNRAIAMKILQARLFEREKAKKDAEKQQVHDKKKEIAWGSQIRSYVLQPYQLVKDHRTGVEIGNVGDVLNGNLDPLIEAYLQEQA